MKAYVDQWTVERARIEEGDGPPILLPFDDMLPHGLCPSAFVACFPYAWTLHHGGWFRWVARRKPRILWRPQNRNLTHAGEVLVVCPNPDTRVLFGVARRRGGIVLRVIDVQGVCPHGQQAGQEFMVANGIASGARFYHVFPYYCAEATRQSQQSPLPAVAAVSGPAGERITFACVEGEIGGCVCDNGLRIGRSGWDACVEELRMPCRYLRSRARFHSIDFQPMGRLCLDAAWAAYPSALAALYDARPSGDRCFRVSCPSRTNRIVWEIVAERRYNLVSFLARRGLLACLRLLGICIDRPDKNVTIRAAEVHGRCPAGHEQGAEYRLNVLDPNRLCPASFAHLYPLAVQQLRSARSRWPGLGSSVRFSCPDLHGANYRIGDSATGNGPVLGGRERHPASGGGVSARQWREWYRGKTVVITGGSSGIGFAVAREVAAAGGIPFLVGRDRETLRTAMNALRAEQPETRGVAADLATAEGRAAVTCALNELPALHVLVNNAGVGDFGPAALADPDRTAAMIRINIEAAAVLTVVLLPAIMEQEGAGGILNVGSFLSWFPAPGAAVYGASKAFVKNFTEALRFELKECGVHVTGLYPGATVSRFAERAGIDTTNGMDTRADAGWVAREGLKGLALNKARVIPGRLLQVKTRIMQWLPASVRSKVL
jgi:uncharacterized protein